jgi:hypothetical protein
MKKHNFRSVIATASIVLGLSGVGPAHADIFGGFLGAASPNTTDAYSINCPIGTVSVQASVNDAIAVGNQISVQVINPNGRATTVSAVDNGPPSPLATLAGGAGTYLVTVHKNTGVGEGYSVSMDCYDAAGAIPGTQSVLVQDQ